MRWPWQRRTALPGSLQWARDVVAGIPARDLPGSALTFAESALRTRNPERQAQHWAKFRAAIERWEQEAGER